MDLNAFWEAKDWCEVEKNANNYNPKLFRSATLEENKMKLNFNGGTASEAAGCGYVLRNYIGAVMIAGYAEVNSANAIESETWGLWEG